MYVCMSLYVCMYVCHCMYVCMYVCEAGRKKSMNLIKIGNFFLFNKSIIYNHRMLLVQTRPVNTQFPLSNHKLKLIFSSPRETVHVRELVNSNLCFVCVSCLNVCVCIFICLVWSDWDRLHPSWDTVYIWYV